MISDYKFNVGDIISDGYKHDNYKRNIGMIINIEICDKRKLYYIYWFDGSGVGIWSALNEYIGLVKIG